MECDTDSLLSLAESTCASSCSAAEISQLQSEILKQSQQIQRFIQSNEGRDDPEPSFVVLKSLFSLFKHELRVNLSLRKLLVDEKKSSESFAEQIDLFFESLRELGYDTVDDFASVLTLIKHQSSRIRKLEKLARRLDEEAQKKEELSNAVDSLRIEEADRSVQIATLNSQLDQATAENRDLSRQLEAAGAERVRIEASVDSLAQEMRGLQARVAAVEQEKAQVEARFAEKREKMRRRMEDAGERVGLLTQQIDELRTIHEQEVADVRRRCKAKVREAARARKEMQTETQKTVDELKATLEGVMAGIREDRQREADGLREELDALRESHRVEMERAKAAVEAKSGEIGELKAQISQLEAERCGDSEAESESRQKFKKLVRKMQGMKAELDRITEMHKEEMERVEREREKREEEIRAGVEASYAAAINKYQLIERELGFQVNEQQIENKRLRDQLRQYSYILEKKEAQLARLQTQGVVDVAMCESPKKKRQRRRRDCEEEL